MRVLLMTNEYPPNIYGGAGVHIEYLSRELSRLTPVEVRSFQQQSLCAVQLKVLGTKLDTSGYTCAGQLVSPLKALATCLAFNTQGIDADGPAPAPRRRPAPRRDTAPPAARASAARGW